MKCRATTKAGARCKHPAIIGAFCGRHARQRAKTATSRGEGIGSDFASALGRLVRVMVREELRAILRGDES